MEHVEPSLQQDDVRGLPRDVDGARDRDADVGPVEGRRVVDPVAEEADDVAVRLERAEDPMLLRRRDAGKDVRLLCDPREGALVQVLDLTAKDDPAVVDADLAADVPSDELVVAGEDLHLHAVAAQAGDGVGDVLEEMVGEGQESRQGELAFVGRLEARGPRHAAMGDRQHPESPLAQGAEGGEGTGDRQFVQGLRPAVDLVRRAGRQDAFRGALGNQEIVAVFLHDDRQATALEVERDFIGLRNIRRRLRQAARGWPRRAGS